MKRALWTLGLAATLLLSAIAPMVCGEESGQPPSLSAYHIVVRLLGTSVVRVRKAIAANAVTSWFYRQTPSIGAAGFYSISGSYTFGAGKVCQ